MKTSFRENFARDLKAVRDKKLLQRVKESIEAVEKADSLSDLPNLKKLKGAKNYFPLKLGDYRIGLALEYGRLCSLPRSKRHLQVLPVKTTTSSP